MKIYLYFDDHDPPHIHIRGQNKAEIYIQTGRYKSGVLPLNKQRNMHVWLNKYQDDIMKA